jgi:hypothetical protein
LLKTVKTRVQNKHDIPANWEKAINFIPLAGELIIYDDHYFDDNGTKVVVADTVKYKVGDGITLINDLPFASADIDNLAPVAKSGRFEDLTMDWLETAIVFDGGDAGSDEPIALVGTTPLQ